MVRPQPPPPTITTGTSMMGSTMRCVPLTMEPMIHRQEIQADYMTRFNTRYLSRCASWRCIPICFESLLYKPFCASHHGANDSGFGFALGLWSRLDMVSVSVFVCYIFGSLDVTVAVKPVMHLDAINSSLAGSFAVALKTTPHSVSGSGSSSGSCC